MKRGVANVKKERKRERKRMSYSDGWEKISFFFLFCLFAIRWFIATFSPQRSKVRGQMRKCCKIGKNRNSVTFPKVNLVKKIHSLLTLLHLMYYTNINIISDFPFLWPNVFFMVFILFFSFINPIPISLSFIRDTFV